VNENKLIKLVREQQQAAGKKLLKFKIFKSKTGITRDKITRFFPGGFRELMGAAKLELQPIQKKFSNEVLLDAFFKLCKEKEDLATWADVNHAYSTGLFPASKGLMRKRFKDMTFLQAALGHYILRTDPNSEFLDNLTIRDAMMQYKETTFTKSWFVKDKIYDKSCKTGPRSGCDVPSEAINFGNITSAPRNEAGVVMLYSYVLDTLGHVLVDCQQPFPDCTVRIMENGVISGKKSVEVEFLAKNYFVHGHPMKETDIIVCWKDNLDHYMKQSLKENGIELIELATVIQNIQPRKAAA